MKQIKAIMVDIDGTLLSSKGYVTERTLNSIKKVRKKGILFGLATGRDATSCQQLLGEWNIEGQADCIIGKGE